MRLAEDRAKLERIAAEWDRLVAETKRKRGSKDA